MDTLTIVEVWILSLRRLLERSGILVRFDRTADQRPKASCVVNLRNGASEADLIVWDSGEADLTLMDDQGKVEQLHFDQIAGKAELADLLARMLSAVRVTGDR